MDLAGKVALVTGAGGARLGRAIALALAARGAAVAVHYRTNAAGAAAVVSEIERAGGRAVALEADLRSPEAIRDLVAATVDRLGGLDVLVNNASTFDRVPFDATTPEDWDAALETNLRAPALLAREAAPHLGARGVGKIVSLTDVAAARPWPEFLPYCVSKAGLDALTRGLALALGPILMPETAKPAELARAVRRVPLGRTGEPADVVAALLFLLEGSDYVTGAVIPVDGGRSTA
jgi:pteridine reductase